jgi:iron(III) transport system substrate-binding protein
MENEMIASCNRVVALNGALAILLAACTPPLAPPPTAAPPAAPAATAPPAAKQAESPAAAPKAAEAKPAASPAAADPLAAATASYYDAAKGEGKLVLYGVGNATLYNPVRDVFMKRFPGVQLEGVDQRGRESREKVIAEQQSRNYVADVVISGVSTQTELHQAGALDQYQPAGLDQVLPELVTPGLPSAPRTVTIFTMAINTQLVPSAEEPKTWPDLLDPKWKGKLAMDDPRGSGPGGTIISGIEALYGLDISPKLAAQNLFFATQAGPIWTSLARGEYAVFLSAGHTDAIAQRKAGAPIKLLKPSDGVGVTQISQSVVKNAPHPNAAKLWIEWSLSEEGQAVLAQQGYATVRKGSKPVEPEASLEGVKILPRDDDPSVLAILGDRSKRWEEIFFKKS